MQKCSPGEMMFSGKDNNADNGMLGIMTAKQEARSLLEKLPDNSAIEDIQYHLTWKR